MPIVIGAVVLRIEVDDPRGLRIIHRIKQQELGRAAVLGKYAEICSAGRQSSTKRKAVAPPRWRRRWDIDCVLGQISQHKFTVGCYGPLHNIRCGRSLRGHDLFNRTGCA